MSKFTWNEETTATAVEAYVANEKDNGSLGEIAKELGTTINSVRSKLVAEKVYAKPEVARRTGGASPVRKIHLVNKLEELTGIGGLDSLENASKANLQALVDHLS